MSPLTALTKFFSGSRSAKPSRRKAPSRRLGVESLEKRQVMAGNVTVGWADNVLQITGDSQDNKVIVREAAPGRIEVLGVNNTRVNGSSYPIRFDKAMGGMLNIVMNGGNDTVWIGQNTGHPSEFKSLNVIMGAGKDTVFVDNTIASGGIPSRFNLGAVHENDTDRISFDRSRFVAATVATGGGDDFVYSTNSTIGDCVISTGNGNDTVGFGMNSVSTDMRVYLDGGHDSLNFSQFRVQRLTAHLGADNDFINTSGLNANSMDVDGGSGRDTYRGPWNSWHPNFACYNFEAVNPTYLRRR